MIVVSGFFGCHLRSQDEYAALESQQDPGVAVQTGLATVTRGLSSRCHQAQSSTPLTFTNIRAVAIKFTVHLHSCLLS